MAGELVVAAGREGIREAGRGLVAAGIRAVADEVIRVAGQAAAGM